MMLSVGLVTTSAYFLSLGASFAVVAADLRRSTRLTGGRLFWYFASAVSFACTWFYIGKWLEDEIVAFDWDVGVFLRDSDLFVHAYDQVAASPLHWFWSSQLLTFVVPWVLFVSLSAAHTRARPNSQPSAPLSLAATLSYIWLGFAGAISVALPLFIARCEPHAFAPAWTAEGSRPKKEGPAAQSRPRGGAGCNLCVTVAVASIVAMPAAKGTWFFGVALASLHVSLLLLPGVLFRNPELVSGTRNERKYAFLALAFAAFLVHAYNLHLVDGTRLPGESIPSMCSRLWAVIWSNHCQSSITLDVFCVTLATVTRCLLPSPGGSASSTVVTLLIFAASPIISPGAAFGLYVAQRL
ncbi:hypothetical protein DIPPA_06993 [Diplonema papillatum]|nr:hypothetical protein DIPPA_06993 [Diplonema papillatum]